jgi:lysophospholipase L1-like esterase
VSGISRRDFVGAASAVGAGAALACVRGVHPAVAPAVGGAGNVPNKATVLFQGDSITDAGRDRDTADANVAWALGLGYPLLVASGLLQAYPDRGLRILNRGISGNKVPDLEARWDKDTIALAPDVVSVLVGVNDYWHTRTHGYAGTAEDYERQYGALLDETRRRLPLVRLVVLEPFVLKTGNVDATWWPAFDARRAAAARVAERAGATYVTLQRELEAAANRGGGPAYWLVDGVHPTPAAHALIAERWRTVVGW